MSGPSRRTGASVLAASLIVSGLVLLPATGGAAPSLENTFAIPGQVGTDNQITAGPDGNMWVTLNGGGDDVAQVAPNGTVTQFDLPGVSGPIGIASAGGSLWLTAANSIVRFDPSNPVATTSVTAVAAVTDPRGMTVGPDGNVWTASGDKVVRIPPANPAGFTAFAGTGLVSARSITATSTALWVADFGGNQIVQVDTMGNGSTFPVGTGPQGIAANTDGQVAFSLPADNPQAIGRALPVVKTPVPLADPFGVTVAPDRSWWVAQFAADNLARVTRKGVLTTPVAFPANSGPRQLAAGPGGTLWVTLDTSDRVAKVAGVEAPPQTLITKRPPAKVKTSQRKARLTYRFVSQPPGAAFQCRIWRAGGEQAAWQSCASPTSYRRPPGRYLFRVRAITSIPDPTPSANSVRIIRRR